MIRIAVEYFERISTCEARYKIENDAGSGYIARFKSEPSDNWTKPLHTTSIVQSSPGFADKSQLIALQSLIDNLYKLWQLMDLDIREGISEPQSYAYAFGGISDFGLALKFAYEHGCSFSTSGIDEARINKYIDFYRRDIEGYHGRKWADMPDEHQEQLWEQFMCGFEGSTE